MLKDLEDFYDIEDVKVIELQKKIERITKKIIRNFEDEYVGKFFLMPENSSSVLARGKKVRVVSVSEIFVPGNKVTFLCAISNRMGMGTRAVKINIDELQKEVKN